MSLAIKFGDSTDPNSVSGVLYVDAVTKYDKTYGGKVTEHPIEAGASISDHYISSNPKFKITGVFSSVDFSSIPSQLSLDGERVSNSNFAPSAISVSDVGSKLLKYIPDVISQFMGGTGSSILSDSSSRKNYKMDIEMMMEKILTGLYYNENRKKWENRMTITTLFEMEGNIPTNSITDLVITSFSVSEDSDSGDALFFDMSLEQVKFVTLEKAEAPKAAKKSSTARSTADAKNKGNQPANVDVEPEPRVGVLGQINEGNVSFGGKK